MCSYVVAVQLQKVCFPLKSRYFQIFFKCTFYSIVILYLVVWDGWQSDMICAEEACAQNTPWEPSEPLSEVHFHFVHWLLDDWLLCLREKWKILCFFWRVLFIPTYRSEGLERNFGSFYGTTNFKDFLRNRLLVIKKARPRFYEPEQ